MAENRIERVVRRTVASAVPAEVLQDEELNADIRASLPSNYSFEVHKCVWRLRTAKARRVALQLPEGLLMYASVLGDLLGKHAGVECVVMGDVTYGACCVDDFSAAQLGCDFLIHYGHSCLVPVTSCLLPMLYVFVSISFDWAHLVECLKLQFARTDRIALIATIQFVACLHEMRPSLEAYFESAVQIPQNKPLSPGEVLGCTAPSLAECDALVYVADGRFHLEAAMIANPEVPAFRYDPYSKAFTSEHYDHDRMMALRSSAVQSAQRAKRFGVILGTLGRQGSPKILSRITRVFREQKRCYFVILLSEISPTKLQALEHAGGVDAWVQIACPRLSIDWGEAFTRPLLTVYEAMVALGHVEWRTRAYPMDYYSKDGAEWSNYYGTAGKQARSGAKPAAGIVNAESIEW
ncbi:2-(3-amino-3-carboxypropyl)histidine synthase subunit 1 [Porphyridium purpureum]|uniref:2-(3-amino-3-carboxypropyl)histidine synthase subunit 1 n=1 Tax=Porphyridium purpureum TaxID=35688 RepID=A0A5J4YRC3_PORPP|nr:2-(3-amino-3-carboxypropyl)histidine synthase subunit 1 [Porphyridium purpureum]|eukprot:POR2887..scf236_6